jgi:hypothetical protein
MENLPVPEESANVVSKNQLLQNIQKQNENTDQDPELIIEKLRVALKNKLVRSKVPRFEREMSSVQDT